MDAQELRIGNFVMSSEEDIIMGIYLDMVETKCHAELLYDMIVPIPLTFEWLERFSWSNSYGAWIKDYGNWTYQLEKHPANPNGWILFINVDGVAAPPSFNVDYVHTFQNIIHALTGTEL